MIKFGIIGYGHIGKRHASHILQQNDAVLTAICDTETVDVSALNSTAPIAVYHDVADFLAQESLDIVSVCTPNYLHAAHAIACMKAGVHVIVEKPLALSVEECHEMDKVSKETGKLIFPVKQNRYNPPVSLSKEWIDDGKLGNLYMIQVNCFWNRNDAYYEQSEWRGKKAKDGGCLFTQFSHFVDILYYLTGDMKAVKGLMNNYLHQHNTEFEDTGSFILKSENGAIINFNFTTCSYQQNMEGSITLMGSQGTIKIGGQYLNTIEYQTSAYGTLPPVKITEKSNDYGFYQGSMSNHDKVIENVMNVLQNNGKIMTSVAQATAVVAIIEDMYQSAKVFDKIS